MGRIITGRISRNGIELLKDNPQYISFSTRFFEDQSFVFKELYKQNKNNKKSMGLWGCAVDAQPQNVQEVAEIIILFTSYATT